MAKQKINYMYVAAVGVLLLALLGAGVVLYKRRHDRKENFSTSGYAANSIAHSGGYGYKRLGGEMNETTLNEYEDLKGNHDIATSENMVRDSSMGPRVANNVVPFDVTVADPSTYLFRTQLPAVQILTRQARAADPFRGDIPITYHPDIPLIEKSKYGRDGQRLDGYFSDALAQTYAKYTNNRPQFVSNQGTIMS